MKWFVLITGVTLIGGLTIAGYATTVWLAQLADPERRHHARRVYFWMAGRTGQMIRRQQQFQKPMLSGASSPV